MVDFIEIKDNEINVQEIMEKIKKSIEQKKKEGIVTNKEIKEIEEMKLYPLPDIQDIHHFYSQHLYQEKKIHPQPEQLEITQEKPQPITLKKRIKGILLRIMTPLSPLIKTLVLPVHQEVVDTNERLAQTNERLIKTNEILAKTAEYVKLLHNLVHNLVAELTKLKVEKEGLKNKMRTLENKIEFLEKREKILEKSIFKSSKE
ncbi:MAG: hypothetical protein ACE5WD_00110 [Candidatus Aminicenantia bacterium]